MLRKMPSIRLYSPLLGKPSIWLYSPCLGNYPPPNCYICMHKIKIFAPPPITRSCNFCKILQTHAKFCCLVRIHQDLELHIVNSDGLGCGQTQCEKVTFYLVEPLMTPMFPFHFSPSINWKHLLLNFWH